MPHFRTSGWKTESYSQLCGITSFVGDCLWSCSYGKDLNTFNPETKLINPTPSLFEDLECQELPFHCHSGSSSTCSALIHEIASGRTGNKQIKKFYWKLWFGDDEVPLANMMFTRTLWVQMLLSIPGRPSLRLDLRSRF